MRNLMQKKRENPDVRAQVNRRERERYHLKENRKQKEAEKKRR